MAFEAAFKVAEQETIQIIGRYHPDISSLFNHDSDGVSGMVVEESAIWTTIKATYQALIQGCQSGELRAPDEKEADNCAREAKAYGTCFKNQMRCSAVGWDCDLTGVLEPDDSGYCMGYVPVQGPDPTGDDAGGQGYIG